MRIKRFLSFSPFAFFQWENAFFVKAGSALCEVSIPFWSVLKFFGWYGLSDTFTKTWSGRLSCVFVVSSLPAIVVDGSKSFSFPGCSLIRIVSSTTPGSVSLVHGFTHDKSVPYLFSTPQARSQQQTEILIHLLKKLAPVNDISGVLYLVDPMWIFSPRIWKTSVLG